MPVLVLLWAFVGYGLLATIACTMVFDALRSRYLAVFIGLLALLLSMPPMGYFASLLGISNPGNLALIGPALMSIVAVLAIFGLVLHDIQTPKTRSIVILALSVLAFAIACGLTLAFSNEERWLRALPETLAIFFPPIVLGAVPFIFFRAIRRWVTLRAFPA